jgi:hypothetical protein
MPLQVRKAIAFTLFQIEHARRVAQLEKERQEQERIRIIQSTALGEMTALVNAAAKTAAEAALLKRLHELALLQEKYAYMYIHTHIYISVSVCVFLSYTFALTKPSTP